MTRLMQPHRDARGVHRVGDDRLQFLRERVERELVAQARAERLDRLLASYALR